MEMTQENRELESLEARSLTDALLAMEVGETRTAPRGYAVGGVRRAVSELNGRGYVYVTSTRLGVQTITRLG